MKVAIGRVDPITLAYAREVKRNLVGLVTFFKLNFGSIIQRRMHIVVVIRKGHAFKAELPRTSV